MLPVDPSFELSASVDEVRVEMGGRLDPTRRAEFGQFMTPAGIARFMASLFEARRSTIRLLDAGAGVGSLTAACVERFAARKDAPSKIEVTAYEVDSLLAERLRQTLRACGSSARSCGVAFEATLRSEDFIAAASAALAAGFSSARKDRGFDAIVLNPPYRKLGSHSLEREMLRSAGIETSNLYTAFVALALRLLEPGGELVAITPRSFCNGPYFRAFREILLRESSLQRVHIFESRDRAFSADDVLQENLIIHLKKGGARGPVVLSVSAGPEDEVRSRVVRHEDIVDPDDQNLVIHLPLSSEDAEFAKRMRRLPSTLEDLRVSVSTGRVVDFRARPHLRAEPGPKTVPLVYPTHFADGFVAWPKTRSRKPNALADVAATRDLMVPNGVYVLTRRFSSKEERRRVVAAVFDPTRLPSPVAYVGFENHLNYFHAAGAGLPKALALGLAVFLNSTLVDRYFRQFNGHTQVNATDLRSLRYPSLADLRAMGKGLTRELGDQSRVDAILDRVLSA
ncbi:MAG: Eco57I restriction-modification methylase domain-containing protein [Planctomycetota bacterium]|mgnify:CR=1 FL=1|nr:Eco57I restriction-modification methylase domain-containing protein [Planctomycetota bacterium]